ncbi:fumarylacetoacetate hydrolase [Blastococcus sp. CT_GayMR20]|uniref:fumarylacetoacetate hydrolase family protein n=1 Tax=Blastococcus sp. CT_GayMR20 TaxID=2559609 RepID=UPI00107415D2|nr:fumarylacetoacetate hydrolase family protein [Blastococcus sp. CT_GayMR20]TFV70587.1 fumarylacetoacetate hydrolase [Blastococcus sp. CT_GayMR20]
MTPTEYLDSIAPADPAALLIGRLHDPRLGGPAVVVLRGNRLVDISSVEPTVSDLLERGDAVEIARRAEGTGSWSLEEVLRATLAGDRSRPYLLAPSDLQVIKAAGVTFVRSMLERVIEERAAGDPDRATAIRARLADVIGGAIGSVRPGSEEAERVKQVLIADGLWSQYLEVGIGPDPEIFTKAPIMSAVGTGAEIGVLSRSSWNNPEPELVLAVTSQGTPVGAMLGNDVNLRDFEGRSALLLTEAKDNNASCAVGPFIRLFDDSFTLDHVRTLDIRLRVVGRDGFVLDGVSSMSEISRDPLELVAHAVGPHHQYPDGFLLFTGTLFAPTEDRDEPGQGFTHKEGDVVSISTPLLGGLVNTVTAAERAPEWTFGVRALMRNLAARGLLTASERPTSRVGAPA